jgi:hypothetical protein
MTKRRFVIDPRGNRIEVETTYDPADHAKSKRRVPTGQRFAMLTPERLRLLAKTRAAAAVVIYCYLVMVNWKNLHRPVKLTNKVLTEIGISHDPKRRALPQLVRAGLIKVEGINGQAPIVTPLK